MGFRASGIRGFRVAYQGNMALRGSVGFGVSVGCWVLGALGCFVGGFGSWVGLGGCYPEGPTYTTIMELGPQNQKYGWFLGA